MAREAHVTPNGRADDSQRIEIRDMPAEKASATIKLTLAILSLFGVAIGVTVWMIDAHAQNPHKGAVPVSVWDERNKAEEARWKRTEQKLDELGKHAMGPVDWQRRTD